MQSAPFSFHRRIGFGDCDGARIIFAPRAIDFAVEAVQAFWPAAAGAKWPTLATRPELEAAVVDVRCEYLRPVTAGQAVDIRVAVVALGEETVTCAAIGESAPGVPAFRAEVVVAPVARGGFTRAGLPRELAARLAAWRASGDEPASVRAGDGGAPRAAGRPPDARDGPAASPREAPPGGAFTREHRVDHGECDPSGAIRPGRLAERAVEVVGEWFEATLGISWMRLVSSGRGAPFVIIRCEALRRIGPGDALTATVTIPRLGSASIDYAVEGRGSDGEPCFRARMTACHVAQSSGGPTSAPFPDDMRDRVLAYQRACAAPARGPARRTG